MKHRAELALETLINAYRNEHLIHGEPCACAVGNLCHGQPHWINIINATYQILHTDEKSAKRIHKVSTLIPYDVQYNTTELMQIESSFEGRVAKGNQYLPTLNKVNDSSGIKGLQNVLGTLISLDPDYFEGKPKNIDFYIDKYSSN